MGSPSLVQGFDSFVRWPYYRVVEQRTARRVHNPEAAGSNPTYATKSFPYPVEAVTAGLTSKIN